MQLCLQIQRQELGTLRLDDRNILPADYVLKNAQFFIGCLGPVVESEYQPRKTLTFVHRRHTTEDRKPLVMMGLLEIGNQWPQDPERILHLRGMPGAVRVRLPYSDVSRQNPVRSCLHLVIANFRVAGIAKKSRVNKREVPHVQK